LLRQLTKRIAERVLDTEMDSHLGYARGITTRDIQAHFTEAYGVEVSLDHLCSLLIG
jgi:transposase-like protein